MSDYVREGGRSEPGETERPDIAGSTAPTTTTAPPTGGYDPSLAGTPITSQADADRYTDSLESLNRNQMNQAKVAASELATLNIQVDQVTAERDAIIESERRYLKTIVRTEEGGDPIYLYGPGGGKYTDKSIKAYQESVNDFLEEAKSGEAALNTYIADLEENIATVDETIEEYSAYTPSTIKHWTVLNPTTGRIVKFTDRGLAETYASEINQDLLAKVERRVISDQARMDYWSTQTPQYKAIAQLTSGNLITSTKTDTGTRYSIVGDVREWTPDQIRQARIAGFNIPEESRTTPPESGIIWDPGYGPTGVTAQTNPVMDVLQSWSAILVKQATWLATGLGVGRPQISVDTVDSQVAWDPGHGPTGVTAIDTPISLPNILSAWAAFNDKLYERADFATEKEMQALLLAMKKDPVMGYLTLAQGAGIDPPTSVEQYVARLEFRLSEGLLGYARNWAFPFSLTEGRPTTPEGAMAQVTGSLLLSMIMPTTADRLFTLAIRGIYKSGSSGVGLFKKFLRGDMTPDQARQFEKIVGQYGYSTSDLRKGVLNLQMGTSIVDDIADMTPGEAIQFEKIIGQYGYSTNDLRKGSLSLLDLTDDQLDEVLKGYKDYFDFWSKNPELYGAGAAYKPALLQEFEDVFTDLGFDVDEYINYLDKWKLGPTLNPAVLMAFTQGIKPPSSEDMMYKDVLSEFDANMQIPDIELTQIIEESIIPVQDVPSIETTDILPLEITVPDIDFLVDEEDTTIPVPPIFDPDVVPIEITDVVPIVIPDIIPDVVPPIEDPDVIPVIPPPPLPIDPIEAQVEKYRRKLQREGRKGIPGLVNIFKAKLKAQKIKKHKTRKQKPSKKNESYRVAFKYHTGANESKYVAAKRFHEAFYIGNRIRRVKLNPIEVEIEFKGELRT